MSADRLTADVLVVGGSTGGTAAAIQAARQGATTVLVSETVWLGGMLTASGVCAPDGNELLAFQTGLWGDFLRELRQQQPGGLDNAWVSFFTYEPRVGAAIFRQWVAQLPNLTWIAGKFPREVIREGDRVQGVRFDDLTVRAGVTLDGTELGDLLALGRVPYRWGWEDHHQFLEPSAPQSLTDATDPLHDIVRAYPVQAPTWVVLLRDAGADACAPKIDPAANFAPQRFEGAWQGYGPDTFLGYGRLPQNQFMLNWPQQGNDYGVGLDRLIQGETRWRSWAEAAIAHSQNFAHVIQSTLGGRYGLAADAFPTVPGRPGGGAFALCPYYRESRRVVGITTVAERDILPQINGTVATLPVNDRGDMSAIAIGNYANDHHYPGFEMPLTPKSLHWGGRWTGTPFTIPYEALIPAQVDGLLVCDKAISVSHIANGATRLQPVVMGIGQAAGMAAALCIRQRCEPRELSVKQLQAALIDDRAAPAAIVPLFNSLPQDADWRSQQHYYRNHPDQYPIDGQSGTLKVHHSLPRDTKVPQFEGTIHILHAGKNWQALVELPGGQTLSLVTLHPAVNQYLETLDGTHMARLQGFPNWTAGWFQVMKITTGH